MSNPTADALGADPYAEPCYCERCQGKRPLPCPYRPEVRTSKTNTDAILHELICYAYRDGYGEPPASDDDFTSLTTSALVRIQREIERLQKECLRPYYCQNCDCAKCGNTRVRPDVPPERASHETVSFPALPISAEDERIADAVTRRLRDETDSLCPHGMPKADNVCGPCSEGRPNRCTRSHPHENMDAECERLTMIARDNNRRAHETAPPPAAAPEFQERVGKWMLACFTPQIVAHRAERNHRFLEESLELVQSLGCTQVEAHMLVDYVFGRPVGEPFQELGGVNVTLAALANAAGLNVLDAAEIELARVWTKIDVIRAKQAGKPKSSPLPGASHETSAPLSDEEAQKKIDDYRSLSWPRDSSR